MALDQSALLEVLDALKAADVGDRVRQAAETVYQALIEAELTETIGAALHERTASRTALRNGHRTRVLSTTAGDLELRIPKLRTGSFFPSLLERRRRVDQALFAVVMEAYLHGVSTRKVDDLVKALGADTGISKSEVSRICADLDQDVSAFRDRSLAEQSFPSVFLDATYCKARVNHRVVSQAVVIATGVAADGHREVLGFAVGDSEDGAFWTAFVRSLKARGLATGSGGVQLVIADAHLGLAQAVNAVLVEVGADPRHLGLGDAAVSTQSLDQVVDLPRRDAVQIGLHHHREQRLIHPPAALQQTREEAAGAQLRDPQLQVPGRGRQGPGAVPVA